jgi:hypothetical protein
MHHLYLRTVNATRGQKGSVTWLLTVAENADLTGQCRLFAGTTPVQDDDDTTVDSILLDAQLAVANWLCASDLQTELPY